MNKDKDKDLRFKAQALAEVSPQDFGVDRYLLLNEQTPIVEMAQSQVSDFDRIEQRLTTRKTLSIDTSKQHVSHLSNATIETEIQRDSALTIG